MRFVRSVCMILLLATAGSAAQNSTPIDSPVIQAMVDELERSLQELQLNNLDKPYFIQYVVVDEEEYTADATFGALLSSNRIQQRILQAQVRVGSYAFDNTEFVAGGGAPPNGVVVQTVMDDHYETLRHSLWLATDAAYKQSVELIARKRAFVQNKIREGELPDFSREVPTQAIATRRKLEFDQSGIESNLREWSRIFRDFPEIQSSSVRIMARVIHRYIVNSEGTRTLQPTTLVSLEVGAGAQAGDGMRISHSIPFNTRSFETLPSAETVAQTVRQLATDLTALRNAPVLDADYSGPVLMTGQASAEMFARVLSPNLSGQRGPMTERQMLGANASDLLNRMNRPVLPSSFSVVDDPSLERFNNKELIGHYQIDDQGVPARRLSLIEDGLLMDLLMSRRPSKERPESNGHGRSGYPGRETAQIGNLLIRIRDGKDYLGLKAELINLCRTERLQYCIVIKSMDSGGRGPIGSPVLAYKVHVQDGREELVRGISIDGLAVSSLRHIQAAGNDSYISNRLVGTRGAETPVSVVAPSVLLEELELKRPTGAQQIPALLTHPYFGTESRRP